MIFLVSLFVYSDVGLKCGLVVYNYLITAIYSIVSICKRLYSIENRFLP
jgi:hypothetical protein